MGIVLFCWVQLARCVARTLPGYPLKEVRYGTSSQVKLQHRTWTYKTSEHYLEVGWVTWVFLHFLHIQLSLCSRDFICSNPRINYYMRKLFKVLISIVLSYYTLPLPIRWCMALMPHSLESKSVNQSSFYLYDSQAVNGLRCPIALNLLSLYIPIRFLPIWFTGGEWP